MPAFSYQAMTAQGKKTRGVLEADSDRAARKKLRDKGLIPLDIKQIGAKNQWLSVRISQAELTLFTRQMATLMAAGIPLDEALEGVAEQTQKDKVRSLILGVRSKVLEGYSLADALNEFPSVFSPLYRATVGSGEQTGKLDVVLEKLADYTDRQQENRQKIQQALIYPAVMVGVSITIVCFLLSFVVPKIIEVFSGSGQQLPEMTTWLIWFSDTVRHYGIWMIILLGFMIVGFRYALKNPALLYRYHSALLKLPVIGSGVKTTELSRYLHTFAILFSAGVPILETMRVSSALIGNRVLREKLEAAQSKVREGKNIHSALKETDHIEPMIIHLIASGEKSGQIAQMMERSAASMDKEINRFIDTSLSLLEPLIILLMGTVVLFIVLATLLPIFSMEQLVG